MKVEFVYWCKHELSLLLQRDDPQFIGRAQYWFNSPVLTMDVFHKLYERSRISLGERYTPESHLDLPIAKVFDGLARTKTWWEELELEINGWIKNINGFKTAVASLEKLSDEVTYESLQAEIDLLSNALIDDVYDKSFLQNIELYKESFNELNLQLSHINEQFLTTSGSDKEKEEKRKHQNQFYMFESETYELSSFLLGNLCQVAYNRSLLLVGEAGIGKSHLLCDTAKRRLAEGLPTLFYLGSIIKEGILLQALKRL